MSISTIPTILMKWAFENKDYYMAYILYTEYKTGIPNSLLYSLPSKQNFKSAKEFIKDNDTRSSGYDTYLSKIMASFKYSKYMRLPEWNNSFGYRLK